MTADVELRLETPRRFQLEPSQRMLKTGMYDPAFRREGGGFLRAHRCPEGLVTLRLRHDRDRGQVRLEAWGPGASWAQRHASALCGLDDDPEAFVPEHEGLRRLLGKYGPVHLAKTKTIVERLVPVTLQQLVTGREAAGAYAGVIKRYGEDAPGPFSLRLPPPPEVVAEIPHYRWVEAGAQPRRIKTLWEIGKRAQRLEEAVHLEPRAASMLLQRIPGIGPWTAEWVVQASHGNPDAVPVRDVHLPKQVCFALAGEREGTDARMLELLEPFRGHRFRVISLITKDSSLPRKAPLPSRVSRG